MAIGGSRHPRRWIALLGRESFVIAPLDSGIQRVAVLAMRCGVVQKGVIGQRRIFQHMRTKRDPFCRFRYGCRTNTTPPRRCENGP